MNSDAPTPSARIIDGRASAARIRARVARAVETLKREHDLVPGLTVVIVGDDPASHVYVRQKGEQTREAGMVSDTIRLDADTPEDELLRLIARLNADARVHGILVQLPLPAHMNADAVIAAIDPAKDVDGFHVQNAGRLSVGLPAMVPCTPLGCRILLEETLGDLSGLEAVVVGRSNIVGKPMAQLLLASHCTVTIAHSRSRDLPALCRRADILVAAVGRPEMIRGDWISPGACVIDVGINRVPTRDPELAAQGKTRLVGDVAFDEALSVAGHITPVPGGVGPMTIACLLMNTVTAAARAHGLDPEAILAD
ncbi:MAG: bifunctional methylenetetrahydrofolate dehydrogenase/methenyltetrahydrofolate cyclohydrolase FolD [Brevundimonas sp.]|jgi:methylenetetrahydrofolate dehydrogenase (NADP+) / methenyltetrahydrofolate cyclohydrolase|uniref:bifunctional methylenetetrahydrofolate dehydrogenase/methenyltetrahydrofolate cyclohydrolase FolD n=1 Tax=Brevundimonas sp. TaxID=1871086 RepID=UPI003919AF83